MMFGLPDDMMVRLKSISANGAPDLAIPGALGLIPHLDPKYRASLSSVLIAPNRPVSLGHGSSRPLLVNNIADADTCASSLRMLEQLLLDLDAPCFNHPRAVMESGREKVAGRLSKIAGVHAPRTIRLKIDEPSDVVNAVRDARINFPIIIRIAGMHDGLTTSKAEDASGVKSALRNIPWSGRELYISEYAPYRDADGMRRKLRLVVVGRNVFMRHLVTAEDWHVHAQDRDSRAAQDEQRALDGFRDTTLPLIDSRVQAIADALDLDYFGIDCSLRPNGDLLVFEANASMNVLLNSRPSPNYWDKPIREIHDVVTKILFTPSEWRHAAAVRSA